MQIIREKTKYHEFAFVFDYHPETIEFCRQLKEKYGWQEFSYDTVYKRWRFKDPSIFTEIREHYPHVTLAQELQDLIKLRKITQIENKSSGKWKLKGELRDYQKKGVDFFLRNDGRALLADDMGSGKTLQAIGFLVAKNIKRTLVICPATAKYIWQEEVAKWSNLSALVIDGDFGKQPVMEAAVAVNKHSILIVNYELLKKYLSLLSSVIFDCLIVDESQLIKSNRAQRTKFAKIIAENIPHVLLLSGTPIMSRPAELYNSLYLIDKKAWPNWYQFTLRYCNGHRTRFGWDYSGASNLEELREKIKPYFLRRTKAEILKELPPKNFIDVPLELTEAEMNAYLKAEKDFVRYLIDYKKAGEDVRNKKALQLVKLNELRQLTSRGKTEGLKELIDNVLEGNEKILVFSVYNEPLERLHADYLQQSVLLTGKTQTTERPNLIKQFQTDPAIKIFLGGTKAAGTAITLTAASSVFFLDYSWTPADMEQAQDRAHRIGQEAENLNIYQLYARNTIDDYMIKLLQKKRRVIDRIIGNGTEEKEEEIINVLVKQLELKYDLKPFPLDK